MAEEGTEQISFQILWKDVSNYNSTYNHNNTNSVNHLSSIIHSYFRASQWGGGQEEGAAVTQAWGLDSPPRSSALSGSHGSNQPMLCRERPEVKVCRQREAQREQGIGHKTPLN